MQKDSQNIYDELIATMVCCVMDVSTNCAHMLLSLKICHLYAPQRLIRNPAIVMNISISFL